MPLKMNDVTGRFEPTELDYTNPASLIARQVGESIAAARKMRGMSQAQAGRLFEVGQNTFSNYERGATQIDYARLVEIALMLQMKPEALMGGLLSSPFASDILDGPDHSVLETTYQGLYWPHGEPQPETPRTYAFAVYGYSKFLSLAVVKTEPDFGLTIDTSTDHLRTVIPGSADHAVLYLERKLATDAEYLKARGLNPESISETGIALDCPHPETAFISAEELLMLNLHQHSKREGGDSLYESS